MCEKLPGTWDISTTGDIRWIFQKLSSSQNYLTWDGMTFGVLGRWTSLSFPLSMRTSQTEAPSSILRWCDFWNKRSWNPWIYQPVQYSTEVQTPRCSQNHSPSQVAVVDTSFSLIHFRTRQFSVLLSLRLFTPSGYPLTSNQGPFIHRGQHGYTPFRVPDYVLYLWMLPGEANRKEVVVQLKFVTITEWTATAVTSTQEPSYFSDTCLIVCRMIVALWAEVVTKMVLDVRIAIVGRRLPLARRE